MRRKIYYVKDAYIILYILIALSFLEYKTAFALFNLVSSAQGGLWDEFYTHARTLIILTIILLPANLIYAYTKGFVIKRSMTKMKTDYMKKVFGKNISEFQTQNNASRQVIRVVTIEEKSSHHCQIRGCCIPSGCMLSPPHHACNKHIPV
mgnify:CR=1 FL=1